MTVNKVLLVGGAPGVGKTTLGRAMAARLGIPSVTTDDLLTVAQAVTSPDTHPGLHITGSSSWVDYYTRSSPEELQTDASRQHEALWPAVEALIRKRARWDLPIVLDGWHLRPHKVAQLGLPHVHAVWVVAAPSVLEERERAHEQWLQASPDPPRMLANFLSRSLWFNELIRTEATAFGMKVLLQTGTTPVEDLCRDALA